MINLSLDLNRLTRSELECYLKLLDAYKRVEQEDSEDKIVEDNKNWMDNHSPPPPPKYK